MATRVYKNDADSDKVNLVDWQQNVLNEVCTSLETDTDKAHLSESNSYD